MSTTVSNPLTAALIDGEYIEDDCNWCDGTLRQKGDWRVCQDCLTTPAGTFVSASSQIEKKEKKREQYHHSQNYRMYGGFNKAYEKENGDGYSFAELEPDTLLHF